MTKYGDFIQRGGAVRVDPVIEDVVSFPPNPESITGDTYTDTSSSYGQGTYEFSASDVNGENYAYKAFIPESGFWRTEQVYSDSDGTYTGSNSYQGIDGENISCRFGSVQSIHKIDIHIRTDGNNVQGPEEIAVFRELDGEKKKIDDFLLEYDSSFVSTVQFKPVKAEKIVIVVKKTRANGSDKFLSIVFISFFAYASSPSLHVKSLAPERTDYRFPPVALTANVQDVAGTGYGDGRWEASASSQLNSSFPVKNIFDFSTLTTRYSSDEHFGIDGTYKGSNSTIDVDSNTYDGEYVQLISPVKYSLKKYSLTTPDESFSKFRMPKTWNILGSNNGTEWYLIETQTKTSWVQNEKTSFVINSNNDYYTYYRLIVESIIGDSINSIGVQLAELELYGTPEQVSSLRVNDNSTDVNLAPLEGNVGVGTMVPQAKLDVRGGDVYIEDKALKNADTDIVYEKMAYVDENAGTKYDTDVFFSAIVLPNRTILKFRRGDTKLYRSTDGGNTWFEQTGLEFNCDVGNQQFVVMSNGDIIGFINNKNNSNKNEVWKSTDGGYNWDMIVSNDDLPMTNKEREHHSLNVLSDDTIIMISGRESSKYLNDVWTSEDGGYTWTLQTSSAPWEGRTVFTSYVFGQEIYILGGYDGSNRLNDIYRSLDKGKTWELVTNNPAWDGRSGQHIVIINGNVIMGGGAGSGTFSKDGLYYDVWISYDKGYTWSIVVDSISGMGNGYQTGVFVNWNNSILNILGTYGSINTNRVFRSDDEGRSWYELTANAGTVIGDELPSIPSTVKLQDGTILHSGLANDSSKTYTIFASSDNGNNWYTRSTPISKFNNVQFTTPLFLKTSDDTLFLLGGRFNDNNETDRIYKSTDKGFTWTLSSTTLYTPLRYLQGVVLSDDTMIYAGGNDGGSYTKKVYRSTDKGDTWNDVGDLPEINSSTSGYLITLSNDDILYYKSNKLYKSSDKGASWNEINSDVTNGYGNINSTAMTKTNNDVIFIYQGQNSVNNTVAKSFVSYDKGISFTEIPQDGNSLEKASLFYSNNEFLVIGGNFRATGIFLNNVTKIPLQSIEDFRTTGITHVAENLDATTIRENGVLLEDKYLKKQGRNVVNGELVLEGGDMRLDRPVEALPMSEPELRYPPDFLPTPEGTFEGKLTNISIVSGEAYGNGMYETKLSSKFESDDKRYPNAAFSNITEDTITDTTYNSSTGLYDGSVITSTNEGDILGEWLQIKYPKPVRLSYFEMQPRPYNSFTAIKDFVFVGSNDEINWNVVKTGTFDEVTEAIPGTYFKISGNSQITFNTMYYSYYRFICESVYVNGGTVNGVQSKYLSIGQMFPYGKSDTLGLQYPPAPLTDNTTVIEGQAYGNGVYEVFGTNTEPSNSFQPYKAFDNNNTTVWTTTATSISTEVHSQFGIYGDYIRIKLPYKELITLYSITRETDGGGSYPKRWAIYGSNDDTTYTQIHNMLSNTTDIPVSEGSSYVFSITNPGEYQYYAIVIQEVTIYNSNRRRFAEWSLYGLPSTDKLYRFPPRGLTANVDTITGEAYGNGEYEVEASSEYSQTYQAYKIFNNVDAEEVDSWASKNGTYTTSGNIGTVSSGLSLGGVLGEWVIIKLPYAINIVSYKLKSYNSSGVRQPRTWNLLASNDNINWSIIHSQINTTIIGPGEYYPTYNVTSHNISYRYFAIVVTNTNLDGTSYQYVQIGELELYGTPLQSSLIQSDANSQVLQLAPTSSGKVVIGKTVEGSTKNEPVLEVKGGVLIGGGNLDTTPILNLQSGNNSKSINNGSQIRFGYNNTNDYAHFIQTRHDASSDGNGNAIDFYTCDGTEHNTLTNGSIHTMSLDEGKVGIGTSSPSAKLDVKGDIVLKGTSNDLWFGSAGKYDGDGAGLDSFFGIRYISNSNAGYRGDILKFVGKRIQKNGTNDVNHDFITFESENGRIGVGTTSPSAKLDVNGDIKASGSITDGSNNSITFTGQHRCYPGNSIHFSQVDSLVGFIVSSNGEYMTLNTETPQRGKDGITISESIPMIELTQTTKEKKVFGVIANVEDPGNRQDQYGLFTSVVSNNIKDRRIFVNSLGEGAIWVSDINGAFENGDYITSSIIPGYGQCQDDDLLHNYTVAKITMDCDFTQPEKEKIVAKTGTVEYEEEEKVLDDNGNVVYEEATVYDESGNIVYEDVTRTDESGNVVYGYTPVYDESGNEILDFSGDEVDVVVGLLDDSGNELEDDSGNLIIETRTLTQTIVDGLTTLTIMVEKTEQVAKTEMVTKTKEETVLDENGKMIWVAELDESGNAVMEPAYEMRYLQIDGVEITKEEYETRRSSGDLMVYRAAFVGCTYHCG